MYSAEASGAADSVDSAVLARRGDVALRLFTFPHAGGAQHSFRDWPAGLPEDVEVVSYSLPGRGRLQDRPAYQDWPRLVADLAELVDRYDDGAPFAFFGHSFGALVAFELCRYLIEQGLRAPRALMLSAHRAAHLGPARSASDVTGEAFVALIRDWGLVSDDLLASDELLQLMVPPLRADLRLDERYPCRTGDVTGQRVAVRCVVYGGADDPTVSVNELAGWREHFTPDTPFRLEMLPGGHFYPISAQADLLERISGVLDEVRAEVGPSIAVAATPYLTPQLSVWARFQAQVTAIPDAPALLDRPHRWSYRELAAAAAAVAVDLAGLGATKGDVVGLLLPHSAEYSISLLACFGLGTPACLLEKNWPASLLHQFLDNAAVRLVVTIPELIALLPDTYQAPDRLLVLDRDRLAAPASSAPAPPVAYPKIDPGDIALISMTSGTSGTPKAVLNTHLGCLYCFDARYQLYPYRESACEGLNVFFGWECLRPLLQGKPAVVIPDDCVVDPVRLVGVLDEYQITRIVVPPSLFESVLDHPVAGPTLAQRLAHMEVVFLMGEVVPSRVIEKAAALLPPQVRLVNAYSTWESLDVSYADLLPRVPSPADASRRAGGVRQSAFAPVGRILDGSAAILLDEAGRPVPLGGVGELYFAGPGVAVGYLDDPAKTAERFVACPAALAGTPFASETFYRTGDRARFLPDGELEILGRTGDVVKVRGFKVSLRALESVLAGQDGVARAIVRPILDSRSNQPTGLLAYILGDQGMPSPTVLAQVRRAARRELPEYARPRHFIGLEALPISGGDSRKLDLAALPVPPDEPEVATAPDSLSTMEKRISAAWREVIGGPVAEPDDNFFDAGGDSLSAARLSGLLAERYGITLPVIEIFQFSTMGAMAAHCSARSSAARAGGTRPGGVPARPARQPATTKVAVIGMAGRFPGAPSIDELWQNLVRGIDSLTRLPVERLRDKGVPDEILTHPDWVAAGQIVADVDAFDARFWGIGQREATLMDPQHRVFIEVAWAAMEQAGYARRDNPYRGRTGVFAACGIDGYLLHHLRGGGLTQPLDPGGLFLTEIGNEKDYIATRVAYLLDLGGPAVTVASACSSALVGVAQAAQAIMSGQCVMAIAGAAAINFPNFGYRYSDGLVGSVDGHVRPFDAEASGTLFGDSAGAVVLKRLDDAIADGDDIWAVLTGFGVSNDGRMKAGYTAPSAQAQAQCISDAIAMAGIDSGQVSYVECHATATHVGDAIEVKGLLDAFAATASGSSQPAGGCAIGSIKGNIGHANCAAGITGFIKTVLCLRHRTLVPTVNFQTLNPKLVDFVDCEGSPFSVVQECREWTVADPRTQLPRRAGVSSFGIGGTNAHVILEEAPRLDAQAPTGTPRGLHLVTVSASSETALSRNAEALSRYLAGLPAGELAAATVALHLSRESHGLRAAAVIDPDSPSLTDDLHKLTERLPSGMVRPGGAATVVFCFSGQGSQTAGMARGLYRGRADGGRFRRHFDDACASLAGYLAADPATSILTADDGTVARPVVTQCGLFAVEYALGTSLVELGVRPVAAAGHSIGEYAAAVLSGLLTLDEAAGLVAVRAQACEELPGGGTGLGGMLSVVGDEQRLVEWLAGRPGLWLAARNAPGRMVLSGTGPALAEAGAALAALGFTCRPVPVSHPFHSDLMAPVAKRLAAAAAGLDARVPAIPLVSNLTGSWFDSRYQPDTYWARHVTSTVCWRESIDTLLRWEPDILLEVGPGTVLTSLARKSLAGQGSRQATVPPVALATMPGAVDCGTDDEAGLLGALGQLWCRGVEVDFAALHEGELPLERGVVARLPTYSFDRTSYWVRPQASIYVDGDGTGYGDPASGPAGDAVLVRYASRPAARTRLYCFAYAGGTGAVFQSWAQSAPAWLDVVAVNLPEHTTGTGMTPVDADGTILADLAERIRSDAGTGPVAFCGLSFGASLVLDLLSGPLAGWSSERAVAVCVAGRAPLEELPRVGTVERPLDRARLADGSGAAESALDEYLIAPQELRADPRWRQTVLPRLRADLAFDARAAARVAARAAGGPVLNCPVQVHCGTEDPSFTAASAPDWASITASPIVDVHTHPGSHEFIRLRREAILDQLIAFLARLDPPGGAADGRWSGLLHDIRWVPANRYPAQAGAAEWRELDEVGAAGAARFLAATLTGPDATAALLCRLPAEVEPRAHCATLLAVLQPLIRAEARGRLILILPACDAAGLVAGLTRSLVQEEPGLSIHRVYVDALPDREPDGGWIEQLLARVRCCPAEVDLLLRGDHLLAQRLLPLVLPGLPAGTLGAGGGGHLITGGTGGIGRAITDWLLHHQRVPPDQVIVTGRADPGDLRPGVRFIPLDFDRPVDPAELANRTGPLAGILHLAGALDDGVLRNLDARRFPAVLAPKLALAPLAEAGRLAGAAWMLLFSSTSALLGSAGQANYAAANGWMDARVMFAPPAGIPAVASVNWGTWGEVGMAARGARALEAARAQAETPMDTGTALRMLGTTIGALLAGTASRNLVVCEVDWRQPPWAGTTLVSDLPVPARERPDELPAAAVPVPRPARGTDSGDTDGVRAFLGSYVHQWDTSRSLADLGLDSLDFARIKGDYARVFGRDIPLASIARPGQRLGDLYTLLSER